MAYCVSEIMNLLPAIRRAPSNEDIRDSESAERRVCRILAELPAGRLDEQTRIQLNAAQLTTGTTGHEGVPGYDDEVFGAIMRAARSDVAAIRDRIRAGERLLADAQAGRVDDASTEDAAAELLGLVATGEVPMLRCKSGN